MRKVNYTYLFPVADVDGESSSVEFGDVSDLLRAADSYLFTGGHIPPLRIINSFLATGRSDHGMSGGAEWEPFALTDAEFENLVNFLDTPEGRAKFHIGKQITIVQPPANILTHLDYSDWKIEEALNDPTHHLNSPNRVAHLANGELVTFREYWEESKHQKRETGR